MSDKKPTCTTTVRDKDGPDVARINDQITKAMGLGTCTKKFNTTLDTAASASGKGSWSSVKARAEGSLSTTMNIESKGCESVNFLSQTYDTLQQVINCAVTSVVQRSNTTTNQFQTFEISVVDSNMVGNITVKQSIQSKFSNNVNFKATAMQEMKTAIKDELKNVAEQKNKLKNELGSVSGGNKSYSTLSAMLDSSIVNESMYDSVQEILNETVLSQNVKIRFVRSSLTGNIDINQEMYITRVSGAITSTVVDAIFSSEEASKFETEFRQINDVKEGGIAGVVDSVFSGIAGIMGVFVLGMVIVASVLIYQGKSIGSTLGTSMKSVAVISVIASLVALIIGIIKGSKTAIAIGSIGLALGSMLCIYSFYYIHSNESNQQSDNNTPALNNNKSENMRRRKTRKEFI